MSQSIKLSERDSEDIMWGCVDDIEDPTPTSEGNFVLESEETEKPERWRTPVFLVARRLSDGSRWLSTYMRGNDENCDSNWEGFKDGFVTWERVTRTEVTKVVYDYRTWKEGDE